MSLYYSTHDRDFIYILLSLVSSTNMVTETVACVSRSESASSTSATASSTSSSESTTATAATRAETSSTTSWWESASAPYNKTHLFYRCITP